MTSVADLAEPQGTVPAFARRVHELRLKLFHPALFFCGRVSLGLLPTRSNHRLPGVCGQSRKKDHNAHRSDPVCQYAGLCDCLACERNAVLTDEDRKRLLLAERLVTIVAKRQSSCPAHRPPVVLVSSATNHADLVIMSMKTMRP